MSLRTLRFGDRTISYDTGLNSLPPELETKKASAGSSPSATSAAATSSSSPPLRPPSATMRISADQDDGIGSSDDETLSTSSSSSNASTTKGEASDDDAEAEEDDGTDNEEAEVPSHKQRPQPYQSPFERDSSPNRDVTRRAKTSMSSTTPTPPGDDGKNNTRKVIRPDPSAIDLLLTFDEEEEDELDEESEQEEEKERKSSQNGWHKTIVKDLATLPSPSSSSSSGRLRRRHSITLCETPPPPSAAQRKSSTGSSTASSSSSSSASSSASSSPRHLSPRQSTADGPRSLMVGGPGPAPAPYSLNVAEMHSSLSEEVEANAARTRRTFGAKPDALKPKAMETLDLRLDEVAHIRSVMTKVELEALPLDGSIREDVEKGKVCFLCMKTRFGLFSRGQRCEMCKQLVCQRCHSKMRIPTEHFSNTPVFALSPSTPAISEEVESGVGGVGGVPTHPAAAKEKKLSLPDNFMQLTNKSVGSAPSSPTLARRGEANAATLNTISGCLAADGPASAAGPVSLPPAQQTTPPGRGQYATLPKKKSRRMSWISSRDAEREKLEGSLLAVCTDCKDMVLQVIRASRTTRRLHMVQSMFLNLTPDSGSMRQNRL